MTDVLTALRAMEEAQGFRVLYACETGSRAWGFASRDSDFDVRFIFVWPQTEYLRVHTPPDFHHEDLPGDLDVSGWDLRKALHHLGKSNAAFYEWLHSPQVYFAGGMRDELQTLAARHFQPRSGAHHYLGLARQLWPPDAGDVNGKKLLYVLRAMLAAQWIIERHAPPPVAFVELLELMESAALLEEIAQLVEAKRAGAEADKFTVSAALREFLHSTRAACEEGAAHLKLKPIDYAPLDELFRRVVDSTALIPLDS